MRVLLNFSTLKSGGGQNVALNFLHGLLENYEDDNSYYFLVVKNSQIHEFLKKRKVNTILTTSSIPPIRVFIEYFIYPLIFNNLKIDIIYTYFGYGAFKCRIPQVCGVAVSNVFFPEVKFWQDNLLKTTFRKLVDRYRIYGIKEANGLIFENMTMEQRCHSLFNIPSSITKFIQPSFNPNFEQEKLDLSELKRNTTKLLMLCGWQLNKNIMQVPEIAGHLKKSNHQFQFIITAPKDYSKFHQKFLALVKKYNVEDMISIIGPVKKQYLESLYMQIDFVILMSKLESFSNNIIEAWYFKKPLLVSNEMWSNEICKDAAYYINRESSHEIAQSIFILRSNYILQKTLIKEGLNQLLNYPSILEKTKSEIEFLKKIYHDFKTIN